MGATDLHDANNPCLQSLRDFNTGYKYLSPLGSFPSVIVIKNKWAWAVSLWTYCSIIIQTQKRVLTHYLRLSVWSAGDIIFWEKTIGIT